MNAQERVYLLASFPDTDSLIQAARALSLPPRRLAVLGSDRSGAEQAARELGVENELRGDIELDLGQDDQLKWHLENDNRPVLAAVVLAEQGRDTRLRITDLGGEMLYAPDVMQQDWDVEVDPGMKSDEVPLPPNYDRVNPQ
jgi:hypothetical protein